MSLPPIRLDKETFLKGNFTLPPLPAIATRIMEGMNSDMIGAQEIADLIVSDPGLVAQVLRVVNSAYFALPSRITNVRHAVAYLGLAEVYRIVLTLSVIKALRPGDTERFERLWTHSYYVSLTARYLARTFERAIEIEELYSAALLHDAGKLVYLKLFPRHYAALEDFANEQGRLFVEAEEHFEFPSHLTLGGLLCTRWRLPDSIKQACQFHELTHLVRINEGRIENPFLKVITIANHLVLLATAFLQEELKERIAGEVKKALSCSDNEFLVLMGEIYQLKEEVSDFLLNL